MKEEKQQWIEDILVSAQGASRATPPPHLFDKIAGQFEWKEAKIIPLVWYRMAVAAAIVLFLVNVLTIYQHSKEETFSLELATETTDSIISNYNLYDQ